MKSEVKDVCHSKHQEGTFYGFITAPDGGKAYYFTTQDLTTDQPVSPGMEVEFDPVEDTGKRQAHNVRVIEEKKVILKTEPIVPKPIKPGTTKPSQPVPKPINTIKELTAKVIKQVEALNSVTEPELFEDGVFLLLRLLGIHTAYQYPRSAQAGEADGFFMIENLAVMYDCTLRQDFESYKQTQISNYKNRLSQSTQLTFNIRKSDGGVGKKTVPLSGKKQVWIITKGETRELEQFGAIKVKEIAVADLYKILERRILDITYDADRLATDLTLLGNV